MSPALIPEIADRPRPTDPVFFLLRPEPHAARRVIRLAWQLRGEHRLTGRPLAEEQLHVSLCDLGPFGRLTRAALGEIEEAAANFAMPPFLVGFGWAESFGRANQRPVVLRGDDTLAGVMMLQNELVTALRRIGLARRRAASPRT
jgi:2'-5' RNA ligase